MRLTRVNASTREQGSMLYDAQLATYPQAFYNLSANNPPTPFRSLSGVGLDGVYPIVVDAGLDGHRAKQLHEALVAGGFFREPPAHAAMRMTTYNADSRSLVSTTLQLRRHASGALAAHLHTLAVRMLHVDWQAVGSPEVRAGPHCIMPCIVPTTAKALTPP
jgi:hypothetical protein